MTKKNKTIIGVVGGLLVVGGIGAATGVGNDENNSSAYISSSIVESSVTSVYSDDNSSALSSSEYISSSIEESSVTSVQSTDNSSVLNSSATSQPEISDVENPNSSTDEPISSVSSIEPPQSTTQSEPELSNNSATHFNDYDNPAQQQTTSYVLNTNTKKFHYPSCSEVKKIKSEHYSTASSRSDAISGGYSPCGRCHP